MVITRYCIVTPPVIRLNAKVVHESSAEEPASFLKSAYRSQGIQYPKFFKMDNLSKLGFLAVETLLGGLDISSAYEPARIGLVLQNISSSLETDERHQESINDRQNYFPSPSVFVYTLPNIMAGEISIRHQIKGENAVFITPQADAGQLFGIVSELFAENRVDSCIAGLVEFYRQSCFSALVLVEKKEMAKSLPGEREMIIFGLSNLERILNEVHHHARTDGKAEERDH